MADRQDQYLLGATCRVLGLPRSVHRPIQLCSSDPRLRYRPAREDSERLHQRPLEGTQRTATKHRQAASAVTLRPSEFVAEVGTQSALLTEFHKFCTRRTEKEAPLSLRKRGKHLNSKKNHPGSICFPSVL